MGYAERVLVNDFGRESRVEALRIFTSIFDPGGEVDVALRVQAGEHGERTKRSLAPSGRGG